MRTSCDQPPLGLLDHWQLSEQVVKVCGFGKASKNCTRTCCIWSVCSGGFVLLIEKAGSGKTEAFRRHDPATALSPTIGL